MVIFTGSSEFDVSKLQDIPMKLLTTTFTDAVLVADSLRLFSKASIRALSCDILDSKHCRSCSISSFDQPIGTKMVRGRASQTRQETKTRQDRTRQDTTRQDKTRHDKVSDKTRQDKTRQDKTKQDKTRQDKTRQDKTRQDKTRQDIRVRVRIRIGPW